MLCYKDRTFCRTPACGDNQCPRILTDAIKEEAKSFGLPLSIAGCVNPKKENTHDN